MNLKMKLQIRFCRLLNKIYSSADSSLIFIIHWAITELNLDTSNGYTPTITYFGRLVLISKFVLDEDELKMLLY